MDLSLVMFKADGTRRDFPVTKDRIVLGRKPTCDLRIPLSSVSRQHCEIEIDGDTAILRDLGSSNGTFHNQMRVHEQELAPGDEVKIGPMIFTVVMNGEPAEIEPVRSYIDGRGDEEGAGRNDREDTQQPGTGSESAGAGGEGDGEEADFPVQDRQEEPVPAAPQAPSEAEASADEQHLLEGETLDALEDGQGSSDEDADLDDPLAALERMAEAEAGTDDAEPDFSTGADADEDDDELRLLEEEDQDQGQSPRKR